MKRTLVVLALLVLFTAIAHVSCPVRPLCPVHNVPMDQTSSNCDDSGQCTVTYHCPAGGEDHTVHCRGGE
jgi:hypothetical protein